MQMGGRDGAENPEADLHAGTARVQHRRRANYRARPASTDSAGAIIVRQHGRRKVTSTHAMHQKQKHTQNGSQVSM